ncbi:MAG TPA: hypothetical protein PKY05_19930, partial [Fibrobacteria bacterium]|nr:hypothetical protein [Fibrobacteria bacterium]
MTEISRIVSCPSRFGGGGLGQHLAKVVSDSEEEGVAMQVACLAGLGNPDIPIPGAWEGRVFAIPPLRWWPAARVWIRHEVYDRLVARR